METKQKKMTAATGRQNDELCAIKRDRDQIKTKVRKAFSTKKMMITLTLFFNYISNSMNK